MSVEQARHRGDSGTGGTLEGVVTFVDVAEGSHQAHMGPHLASSDGGLARVYAFGDNPFENATFRALEGARVRVEGTWRNGVLRVEPSAIVVLVGPAGAL